MGHGADRPCGLVVALCAAFVALGVGCAGPTSYDYYLRSDLFGRWYRCMMADLQSGEPEYTSMDSTAHSYLDIDPYYYREYFRPGGFDSVTLYVYRYWLERDTLCRAVKDGLLGEAFECRVSFRGDTLVLAQPGTSTSFHFLPYDGDTLPPRHWPEVTRTVD